MNFKKSLLSEMTLWVRILAAKTVVLNLFPRTHMVEEKNLLLSQFVF